MSAIFIMKSDPHMFLEKLRYPKYFFFHKLFMIRLYRMIIVRSLMPPIGYFKFGLILPLGAFSDLIVSPLHGPAVVVVTVVVVAEVDLAY